MPNSIFESNETQCNSAFFIGRAFVQYLLREGAQHGVDLVHSYDHNIDVISPYFSGMTQIIGTPEMIGSTRAVVQNALVTTFTHVINTGVVTP